MELKANPGQKVWSNVQSIMRQRGISRAEFTRRMGVTSPYISNWEKRGFPSDRLSQAADVLGTTVDVLVGRVPRSEAPEGAVGVSLTGCVPVLGFARLGDSGFYEVSESEDNGYLTIPSPDPNAYALRCEGTSMIPRIQPGEFVIAEPSHEAMPGDEVVVQAVDGRVMVKRYLYRRNGIFHFGSVNSEQETILIESGDVRAIHPVLAIVPKRFLK